LIHIGHNILSDPDILLPFIQSKQVLIVTQQTIAQWYLKELQAILTGHQCDVIFLAEGEQYKNIEEWQKIISALVANKHERDTTLIALGGGMVGDMTGFAAACYQRGVNYIQIPTTLIGQVDSAIGGKTGINHPLGKNLIGAFYHPQCIIADVNTLTTLSDREFSAGLAEVVKYGLICDADFFGWLEKNIVSILAKDKNALLHIVRHCSAIKTKFVALDEKDHGERRLLNFGHTFGHALETLHGYQAILHGEAVAIGMIMAAQWSEKLGFISAADVLRIRNLLDECRIKMDLPSIPYADLIEQMHRDKKVKNGELTLVLLEKIGKAVVSIEKGLSCSLSYCHASQPSLA